MKTLALEFSSPQRSVAVVYTSEGRPPRHPGVQAAEDPGVAAPRPPERPAAVNLPVFSVAEQVVVSEVIETARGNTMKPLGLAEEAMKQAGIEREQIECLAIGLGPGSYTGIRAAISLAQGWQLARGVKLIGVSSAECVAAQAQADGIQGRATVVIDAQRGEFYLAGYDLQDAAWRETAALRLATVAEARAREQAGERMIGPEVKRWFPAGRVVFPRAATLGRLAVGRNDFVSGGELEPIYLREANFVKAPLPRVIPRLDPHS